MAFARAFENAVVDRSKTPYGICLKVTATDVPFNGLGHRVIYVKSAIPGGFMSEQQTTTTHALSVFKPLGGFFTWTYNDASGEHALKVYVSTDAHDDMEDARAWQPLIADIICEHLPALVGGGTCKGIDLVALRNGDVKVSAEVVA